MGESHGSEADRWLVLFGLHEEGIGFGCLLVKPTGKKSAADRTPVDSSARKIAGVGGGLVNASTNTRARDAETRLAASADVRFVAARDRALLLLGFAVALRRSELVALDVEEPNRGAADRDPPAQRPADRWSGCGARAGSRRRQSSRGAAHPRFSLLAMVPLLAARSVAIAASLAFSAAATRMCAASRSCSAVNVAAARPPTRPARVPARAPRPAARRAGVQAPPQARRARRAPAPRSGRSGRSPPGRASLSARHAAQQPQPASRRARHPRSRSTSRACAIA